MVNYLQRPNKQKVVTYDKNQYENQPEEKHKKEEVFVILSNFLNTNKILDPTL